MAVLAPVVIRAFMTYDVKPAMLKEEVGIGRVELNPCG